jgi:cell division GTPase FtsZ
MVLRSSPVKPDGRSLDIVVIGLGQAGGNIATEFYRRGYGALALNTAASDLAALEPGGVYPPLPAERRLYIGMDGYDGAGADPAYGQECVREHAEQIREAVLREGEDADAIFLAAGLGGGTGSSLSALVGVLADLDLPLLGLMTLPSHGESGIVKVNAVRAINEMVDASLLGWVFIDNARLSELNQDVSVVDYFAHVNGRIASPIDALNRLNNRDDLRSIRSFDGEDLRKLLLSGGVLNYGVVELPNVTPDEVIGGLKDNLDSSDLMPGGFEFGTISYLGLVIEASEATLAQTPIATFEQIDERLKKETGGAAIYRGIYRTNDPSAATTMRFMCACQSLPHRIREILADARKEGMAIREKLQIELPTLDLGEIERFELFRPGARSRHSDRPRRARTSQPAPSIEDLRVDIMRPRRPAQSPNIKRQARSLRPPTPAPPVPPPSENGARSSAPAESRESMPSPSMIRSSRAPGAAAVSAPPPSAASKPSIPVATRRPAPPPPAPPQPKRPAPALDVASSSQYEEPSPESVTHEIDLEKQMLRQRESRLEPRVQPIPSQETEELPSPEAYDKLVTEFLHSHDESARDRIADRLEADSQSEHTVIRYYAVEAMSKLGREVFGNALLSATEDENEAVRAIAVEALRR